jgi:GMP synthase-like glutamine amidotransferase
MNVDQVEQYPFLAREIAWIREALRAKLPILGLCLGAQLLAKALGARVTNQETPEVGWRQIMLTSAGAHDPLLSDIPSPATVFQWHGDTFELPVGGVLLAENEACAQQAFRFGTTAWGLQFHAEIGAAQIQAWVTHQEHVRDRCTPTRQHAAEILELQPALLPQAQILGRKILGRFGKLCREQAQAKCKALQSANSAGVANAASVTSATSS